MMNYYATLVVSVIMNAQTLAFEQRLYPCLVFNIQNLTAYFLKKFSKITVMYMVRVFYDAVKHWTFFDQN